MHDPIRERFTGGGSAFFHERKRDLIRRYLRRYGETRHWSYLDLGCGQGELIGLLRHDFGRVAGCDPSGGMLQEGIRDVELRRQTEDTRIPFDDCEFDFVTSVCVYHHVPPGLRPDLMLEVRRVLKPGGRFCIIEHNPWNPVTRLIVSRTPVDANAILLPVSETHALFTKAGFTVDTSAFFLYFPQSVYRRIGILERALSQIPLEIG